MKEETLQFPRLKSFKKIANPFSTILLIDYLVNKKNKLFAKDNFFYYCSLQTERSFILMSKAQQTKARIIRQAAELFNQDSINCSSNCYISMISAFKEIKDRLFSLAFPYYSSQT